MTLDSSGARNKLIISKLQKPRKAKDGVKYPKFERRKLFEKKVVISSKLEESIPTLASNRNGIEPNHGDATKAGGVVAIEKNAKSVNFRFKKPLTDCAS